MRGNGYVGGGRFPTTHWSLVAMAGRSAEQSRREALGNLLERYTPALRAHLVYGRRLTPEDADDLMQEFVAHKILERDLIARADQQLGRFRTYLLAAIDRFLIDFWRRQHARKRGDGPAIDLGEAAGELAEHSPRDAFDLAWAREVIADAVAAMQEECRDSGRPELWRVFDARVLQPILTGTEPPAYDDLLPRLGLDSPTQAANLLVTAKRMFARAVRSVVGQYARGEEEIAAEIRDLYEALRR